MGGAPTQCYGSHQDDEKGQGFKYQLGLGIGSFNSTLRFDDDSEVDIRMNTISISGGMPLNQRWTMHAVIGMILNGELKPETGSDHDVKPGGFASIGLDYSAFTGKGYKPYIDLSILLGASMAETENSDDKSKTDYMSTDVRLGVRSSWNVNNFLFPFAAVRVFGGPVMWEIDGKDVTGSDIYHYQLAIGSALQLGKVVAYFEWAGIGEKVLNAGLSIAL